MKHYQPSLSLKLSKNDSFFQSKTFLVLVATILAVFATATSLYMDTSPVRAATTPDSCFAFNEAIGSITNYYNNEANNISNPACPKDVTIPSSIGGTSVIRIFDNAFFGKQLTSVSIPSSVASIGNYAFYNNQLTSASISLGVTSIGNSSFAYNKLTSVSIPSTVTSIGGQAFTENQLTSVSIPSGVTSIDSGVFYNNQLTSVSIPSTVTSIGSNAFARNQLTSVSIPSTVTSIGDSAFSNNQLTSVSIPSSITSISNNTFYANQLTSVSIPPSVTSIGNYAFLDNNLTSVSIPSTVTSIGNSAFGYNSLTSVSIPSSITSIGTNTFYANQLTSVSIPPSVTSIGNSAFSANNLTSVTLSEGLQSIDSFAFQSNKLTSVTIPSTVTSISPTAFSLQNPWGETPYTSGGPDIPYLWSYDPAEVQRVFDSIWYVRLYTVDPTNPQNLTDGVLLESQEMGWDANENGTTADSLGGHIVNPSSAEISYVNSAGQPLQSAVSYTGSLNGNYLSNYLASQGPLMPEISNPESPTAEEQQALDAAFSAYFRQGQEVEIIPAEIEGYATPEPFTVQLTGGETAVQLTYLTEAEVAEGGGSAQPGSGDEVSPDPNPVDSDTPLGEGSLGGELADTGMNYWLFGALGLVSLTAGVVVLVSLRRN